MFRIITTLFLLFISYQTFAQRIEIYDIAIDKTDTIDLPDTIYCLYGTIEENKQYNYFEWHEGTTTEKVHYFINEPQIVEIAHEDWYDNEMYYKKHVSFDFILYITDGNIEEYLGATNVKYIDTTGKVITKDKHQGRITLYEDNFRIMMELQEYYKNKNKKDK